MGPEGGPYQKKPQLLEDADGWAKVVVNVEGNTGGTQFVKFAGGGEYQPDWNNGITKLNAAYYDPSVDQKNGIRIKHVRMRLRN